VVGASVAGVVVCAAVVTGVDSMVPGTSLVGGASVTLGTVVIA
jgi:hypothetical protein